jgi:hypothetical protein
MEEQDERDPQLTRLLARWEAPDPGPALDDRIVEAYRKGPGRVPLWRRFMTLSVPVPLPVAVAVLVLLAVSAAVALRRSAPMPQGGVEQAAETAPLQTARAMGPPAVTRTSLAGFQPVSEMNLTVVQEGVRQ